MAMETGLMWFEEGDYSKARRRFDKMVDYYRRTPGLADAGPVPGESSGSRDAEESMRQFRKACTPPSATSNVCPGPATAAAHRPDPPCRGMDTAGMRDSAQVVMELGQEAFMENAEFKGSTRN